MAFGDGFKDTAAKIGVGVGGTIKQGLNQFGSNIGLITKDEKNKKNKKISDNINLVGKSRKELIDKFGARAGNQLVNDRAQIGKDVAVDSALTVGGLGVGKVIGGLSKSDKINKVKNLLVANTSKGSGGKIISSVLDKGKNLLKNNKIKAIKDRIKILGGTIKNKPIKSLLAAGAGAGAGFAVSSGSDNRTAAEQLQHNIDKSRKDNPNISELDANRQRGSGRAEPKNQIDPSGVSSDTIKGLGNSGGGSLGGSGGSTSTGLGGSDGSGVLKKPSELFKSGDSNITESKTTEFDNIDTNKGNTNISTDGKIKFKSFGSNEKNIGFEEFNKTSNDYVSNANTFANNIRNIEVKAGSDKSDLIVKRNEDIIKRIEDRNVILNNLTEEYKGATDERRKEIRSLVLSQKAIAAREANSAVGLAGATGLELSESERDNLKQDVISKYARNINEAEVKALQLNRNLDNDLRDIGLTQLLEQGKLDIIKDDLKKDEFAPLVKAIDLAKQGDLKAKTDIYNYFGEFIKKKGGEEFNRGLSVKRVTDNTKQFKVASPDLKLNIVNDSLFKIPGYSLIADKVQGLINSHQNASFQQILSTVRKMASNANQRNILSNNISGKDFGSLSDLEKQLVEATINKEVTLPQAKAILGQDISEDKNNPKLIEGEDPDKEKTRETRFKKLQAEKKKREQNKPKPKPIKTIKTITKEQSIKIKKQLSDLKKQLPKLKKINPKKYKEILDRIKKMNETTKFKIKG